MLLLQNLIIICNIFISYNFFLVRTWKTLLKVYHIWTNPCLNEVEPRVKLRGDSKAKKFIINYVYILTYGPFDLY